jgi:hypothetical protein
MASEFSAHEVPLFPGHLVGIRAMLMEEGGRVYSPQQHYLWMNGENQAGCLYFDGSPRRSSRMGTYMMSSNGKIIVAAVRQMDSEHHTVATRNCTCGFYAYFHDRYAHSYLPGYDGIYAIVKGYGRVTYGDQGFRAEKMEILAFIKTGWDPDEEPTKPEPPKQVSTWRYIVGLVISFLVLVTGLVLSFTDTLPFPWPSAVAWSGTGMSVLIARRYRRRSQTYHTAALQFAKDTMKWIQWQTYSRKDQYKRSSYSTARVAKVQHRYPDLPIYDTIEEALKDYVLTDPQSIK